MKNVLIATIVSSLLFPLAVFADTPSASLAKPVPQAYSCDADTAYVTGDIVLDPLQQHYTLTLNGTAIPTATSTEQSIGRFQNYLRQSTSTIDLVQAHIIATPNPSMSTGDNTFTLTVYDKDGSLATVSRSYTVKPCQTPEISPQEPVQQEVGKVAPQQPTASITATQVVTGVSTTSTIVLATSTAASSTEYQAKIDAMRQLIATLLQIIAILQARQ